MFLFGHLCGMAVLNGIIQARSGLSLTTFGVVLATGAIAALLANIFLKRLNRRPSTSIGLLLLTFAVWLPVLAQDLPSLLLAYSLQGAASRIALAGLYRAIAAVQRDNPSGNTTLVLESMAGFGLSESFLLNAILTHYLDSPLAAATLALALGVPISLWLRSRVPTLDPSPALNTRNANQSVSLLLPFTAYCAEVFTMTQATAWSTILVTRMTLNGQPIPPLLAGGFLTATFWLVVALVRFGTSRRPGLNLQRFIRFGNILCILAILGTTLTQTNGLILLLCYAALGAGIACFVPFALQQIAQHPQAGRQADRMALLGPVMSVGVHVLTGLIPGQREVCVLAALTATLLLNFIGRRPTIQPNN
jgi:hypothetical protein